MTQNLSKIADHFGIVESKPAFIRIIKSWELNRKRRIIKALIKVMEMRKAVLEDNIKGDSEKVKEFIRLTSIHENEKIIKLLKELL